MLGVVEAGTGLGGFGRPMRLRVDGDDEEKKGDGIGRTEEAFIYREGGDGRYFDRVDRSIATGCLPVSTHTMEQCQVGSSGYWR